VDRAQGFAFTKLCDDVMLDTILVRHHCGPFPLSPVPGQIQVRHELFDRFVDVHGLSSTCIDRFQNLRQFVSRFGLFFVARPNLNKFTQGDPCTLAADTKYPYARFRYSFATCTRENKQLCLVLMNPARIVADLNELPIGVQLYVQYKNPGFSRRREIIQWRACDGDGRDGLADRG